MLAMMLPCLGAWAEVAPLKVSTDAQKYYYVIKNFRSHKFAYYNGDNGQLLQQTNPTSTTAQEDLDKYLWYVTEASGEGAYMLHNVATNKVYAAYNSFTEAGAVVYIKENPYKAGYVCVSSNADATTTNSCWDDQGSQTKIGPYETRQNDNNGTSWEFIEIETQSATVAYTLTDNAGNSFNGTFTGWSREMYPVVTGVAGNPLSNIVYGDRNVTATVNFPFPVSKVGGTTNWTFIRSLRMSDGKAYLYVNTSNNKIVTKSEIATNGTLGYLPTAIEGEVQKWMWAIYPTLTEGKFTFQIKNAATGKFAPSATRQEETPLVSETAGNYSWGTCIGSGKGFYLDGTTLFLGANSSAAGEKEAIIWNKSGDKHQGCNLEFTAPIYTANINIVDNNNAEYFYFGTVNYTAADDVERPVITGIFDSWITNTQWSEGTCNVSLTFPFTPSSATTSNPIQIANWGANDDANKKRWHAVLEDDVYNVKAQTAVPNINEWDTWLWEIYPQFNSGAFTYHIKNAHTGTYVYVDPTKENAQGGKGYVTLSETPTTFNVVANGNYINWGYTGNNKTLKLTTNGSGDTDVYLGSYNGTHAGNHIAFPALTKFNLTVGSTGYASLYTPVAGTFAGEVITYAVTEDGIVNGYANLTKLTGVAANQGAIVEAAPGTYTFTAGDVSSDWNGNLLTGTSVNTMVEGDAYVLGNVDGVGLYKALLTDGRFLNNAGKAYLPATVVTTTAKVLRFNFGGNTTAIESVHNNGADANAPIYDLTGRRVVNAVKGGIYIQNGKKFIVK